MPIPENCRIDLYFPADKPELRKVVESTIDEVLKPFNYTLIASGYALHYQNYMMASLPEGVSLLKERMKTISNVYMNEYPPEIARELSIESDEHECDLCLGTGFVDDGECPECQGLGTYSFSA